MLQGVTVCPGVAIGPAFLRDDELTRVGSSHVSTDRVNDELNRFREALDAARRQLMDLKTKLEGKIRSVDARIFDTHLTYLKDPIFITDVEKLVLEEQMGLESAIAKVISDFDRVFKLVESEYLRERALDLRDVGIRVLRCLRPAAAEGAEPQKRPTPPDRYVLCAKDLSIVDMFSLGNERVEAILTEEVALTSHAAILARSMRIPTLMGVKGLLKSVKPGDTVLVDASGSSVHISPDERLLAEYGASAEPEDEVEEWVREPTRTRDGTSIGVLATGGNHDDVERAVASRMTGMGLYRCELLFLYDRRPPEEESLYKHFARAVELAHGNPITFRLLDVDSSSRLEGFSQAWKSAKSEGNPALGMKSIRALFKEPQILRVLLRALLRASAQGDVRVVVPFVTDASDVRRVKELMFDEKQALRKARVPHGDRVPVGAMIEIPAAALGARDLLGETDFLIVALDSLVQYLLAADRENEDLRGSFAVVHPMVLRAVRDIVAAADGLDREVIVHGELVANPANLPLLLGAGVRRFGVAPVAFPTFKRALAEMDLREARRLAADALRCSTAGELEQLLIGYRG